MFALTLFVTKIVWCQSYRTHLEWWVLMKLRVCLFIKRESYGFLSQICPLVFVRTMWHKKDAYQMRTSDEKRPLAIPASPFGGVLAEDLTTPILNFLHWLRTHFLIIKFSFLLFYFIFIFNIYLDFLRGKLGHFMPWRDGSKCPLDSPLIGTVYGDRSLGA